MREGTPGTRPSVKVGALRRLGLERWARSVPVPGHGAWRGSWFALHVEHVSVALPADQSKPFCPTGAAPRQARVCAGAPALLRPGGGHDRCGELSAGSSKMLVLMDVLGVLRQESFFEL